MDALLDFARGPLFRLTFALMILGLARILLLDLAGIVRAYRRAGDKSVDWKSTIVRTIDWLFPARRFFRHRPVYSLTAILFHIGLILTPLFLFAHVQLWRNSIGFGWWTLSPQVADILTLATIVLGIVLFAGRVFSYTGRALSRPQDFLWPLLLIVPFVTGYICTNLMVTPKLYELSMLVHVLSGELIFVLIPFTKIAHCILMPLSQVVSAVAWKFPAAVDEDVCATLDKEGAPV